MRKLPPWAVRPPKASARPTKGIESCRAVIEVYWCGSILRRRVAVSQGLGRWQAAVLGLVVLAALSVGGYGLARIAHRQGVWAETVEATVGFPEAHDVNPGTPVRVRGVEAGQVVAVEYPPGDGPGALVKLRLRL